jgi:hypothetical protein
MQKMAKDTNMIRSHHIWEHGRKPPVVAEDRTEKNHDWKVQENVNEIY